ncbi:D-amino acid dehydrogenase [Massilia sp. TS11]|uniref:D-amino acid dehydrogenase n=1 Tax=Massilia sp. TS11 TaxID=2908003 RepID=UPI001EDB1DDB|nr:D-amino acid dehydrogenase [Massilia sp. TS11]MCG2585165.1 D-amino acid dehydrogenase [Massilia sp. TS11]
MQDVIVIGGGVVGLTTAWWLAEAGCRVSILERRPQVAAGASARNGGQLSYRYVAPLADAGVPLKALGWLFQVDGPLRFKPEADLRQYKWLSQFLANCRADRNARTTGQLLPLGELSRQMMATLENIVSLDDFAWRDAGKLVVYRTPKTFAHASARPASDSAQELLDPAQCVAREPALAKAEHVLAGGIFTHGEAVADCQAFCQALLQRLQAHPRFGGVIHEEARRIVVENGRATAITTDEAVIGADAFVLAAGIQSRNLAATAGVCLPLYPLKGYSLTAPIRPGDQAPEISVTDFERKVLYARIGDQLRVAAMVDMVGEDERIDQRRIDSLTRLARETMPDAADYSRLESWTGLRPATPDSAPILGPSGVGNLWLNLGQGPLGFTFACGSARVVTDLMLGRTPPIALDGLLLR